MSAGELLREERASGSENGDLIDSYIKEGKIVPVEITISLIEEVLNKICFLEVFFLLNKVLLMKFKLTAVQKIFSSF